MKTLRAHGFNQRPRFEQVVGYLERNEPLLDQPDRKRPHLSSQATSTWTISYSPARTPTRSLCSTRLCKQFPRKASALPQRPRTRTCALRGGGYGGTRFVEDNLAGDPRRRLRRARTGQHVQTHVLRRVLGQLRAESLRGCEPRGPCAYEVRCRLSAVCSAAQAVRDGGRPVTWSASWTRRGSARRRWSVVRRP